MFKIINVEKLGNSFKEKYILFCVSQVTVISTFRYDKKRISRCVHCCLSLNIVFFFIFRLSCSAVFIFSNLTLEIANQEKQIIVVNTILRILFSIITISG